MSKIVSIRKVANGSFQAEMEGLVERPGAINVLAHLNIGDERFKSGSTRRAWFPVTLLALEQEFHVSAETISKLKAAEEGERVAVEIINPSLGGDKLAIQVNETVTPNPWQKQNVARAAKQLQIDGRVASSRIKTEFDLMNYLGETGYFVDSMGNLIFSTTTVNVASQLKHTFIDGMLVPASELGAYGATLATAPAEAEVEQD